MSLSNSLSHYNRIRSMLDKALTEPAGSIFDAGSEKKAIYWRRQAYHFRRLLTRINDFEKGGAGRGTSPYDDLVITVKGNLVLIQIPPEDVLRSMETGEIIEAAKSPKAMQSASHFADLVPKSIAPPNETQEQRDKRALGVLNAYRDAKIKDDAALADAIRKEQKRNEEREEAPPKDKWPGI